MRIKLFQYKDIIRVLNFQKKLQVLVARKSLVGAAKKTLYLIAGTRLDKTTGKGTIEVVFSIQTITFRGRNYLSINLRENKNENLYRKKLLESLYRYKKIKITFKSYKKYGKQEVKILKKYIDQIHPEAVVMSSICQGKGVDVGCGFRKTHPDAIGVDWVGKGELGKAGNAKGKVSEADIKAKGDNLKMFKNNSLDYVVARHNLEHYHKPERTLREWLRVLKRGGYLGIVVPNSVNPHTAEKTHYYNFTLENLNEMLIKTQQIRILKIGECIPGWSFYCIAQKL